MTTVLESTIAQVRATIYRARMSQLLSDRLSLVDVDSVKSQLVDPIIGALDWAIDDPAEVNSEYRLNGVGKRSGIALFLSGAPSVLIELRGLRQDINQRRLVDLLLPSASRAGFEWVLLTDGDVYEVFNTQVGLPVEHGPFDGLRISDDSTSDIIEFLELFSRKWMEENQLETVWNRRVIDRQVQRLFEELQVSDDSLARLILSRTEDLSAADVRSSLARAKISLQFDSMGRSQCRCSSNLEGKIGPAAEMSEAELRVATWLQRRSIERWAKGDGTLARSRTSQRRQQEHRRAKSDRRTGGCDRRTVNLEQDTELRSRGDRRSAERRRDLERRVKTDRRRVRRRA